jgi:hypothetical protein
MDDASAWNGNWGWSLPIIVLTVVFHVIGLGLLNAPLAGVFALTKGSDLRTRHRIYSFVVVVGIATIWVTFLHAVEAGIWATAFRLLGAVPTNRSALLFSLEAITTYGHSDVFLAENWRLMGALEALNGVILIGLTTAFLYGAIQRGWPVERVARAPSLRWSRRGHHAK